MRESTTELFQGDVFTRHGLYDVGTGDEHVTRSLHHEDEVGKCRRIHATTGAGSKDHGDLRNNTRGLGVSVEDAAVGIEPRDSFLDASAGAVVETNDGKAHRRREVHDLVNFLAVRFTEGATKDREVL